MCSVGRRRQHGCECGDAAEMAIRRGVEDAVLDPAFFSHKHTSISRSVIYRNSILSSLPMVTRYFEGKLSFPYSWHRTPVIRPCMAGILAVKEAVKLSRLPIFVCRGDRERVHARHRFGLLIGIPTVISSGYLTLAGLRPQEVSRVPVSSAPPQKTQCRIMHSSITSSWTRKPGYVTRLALQLKHKNHYFCQREAFNKFT
ncbi:hypothetical protein F5887DRAFT_109724 [Amanita rubescens]|nr:hypothetical protein F5887DRAFT_109724 [Amanita rubescens]